MKLPKVPSLAELVSTYAALDGALKDSTGKGVPEHVAEWWRDHQRRSAGPREHDPLVDDYAALNLLPEAPDALIRPAWLLVAQRVHPDKGGSVEAFRASRAAYERICEARGLAP